MYYQDFSGSMKKITTNVFIISSNTNYSININESTYFFDLEMKAKLTPMIININAGTIPEVRSAYKQTHIHTYRDRQTVSLTLINILRSTKL